MGTIGNITKIVFKNKIFFTVLIITCFMTHPSFAEKISLDNISDYINGLKMVEADFLCRKNISR